ncbi:MAG TPA: glutamate--tRNA ligase, partial [Candidatus Kapabacteria bacterium]|nr:glutamate--tRNA ligase [Candidatus Kapabacteria bacterium]
QVLLKTDGYPTYHFAVVVDDHIMGITHVIRGEEWVSSTPKHLQLYAHFGWEAPAFAHLSLLLNPDKSKLSKRQGDVSVQDYRDKGYLPEALVNFVAFLGWNPGDERELFTIEELEKEFSLDRVSKAGAVFNLEKLDWYNQQYIRSLPDDTLVTRAIPYLVNSGLVTEVWAEEHRSWLRSAIGLEKERMTKLQELPDSIRFVFLDTLTYDPSILIWKKGTKEDAQEKLQGLVALLETVSDEEWQRAPLEKQIRAWMTEKGYGTGDVLWPMRVALSGQKNSPGPFDIAEVLGKEKTLARLRYALTLLV